MYDSILGYTGDSPGVQRNMTPQSTDAAARQALEEQQYGDEFNPKPNPDIEALVARLNELETEQTNLSLQLYGPSNWYESHGEPYKGPPYLEKERIHREIDRIDNEIWAIKAQLREVVDGMANLGMDNYGPYAGTAAQIISPDSTAGA